VGPVSTGDNAARALVFEKAIVVYSPDFPPASDACEHIRGKEQGRVDQLSLSVLLLISLLILIFDFISLRSVFSILVDLIITSKELKNIL
jgi:hypothetical protein